jgi:cytoskeletal protein CcmA (bactofilin family)
MKNKTSLIVALSSLLACALFAAPAKINYQGLITDTAGEPIESGTNTVTVTLYQVETDGTSIYTESFIDVTSDADGIYSIQIGDTNLQAVLEANSELWLELVINGQTLSPRQEINSVPYALVADSANRLINASDSSISGDLSVSGNSIFSGNSTFNGNSTFGNDIDVSGRVDAMDGRFHMLDVMGRVMASDIHVHGSLEMSGYRANFENAQEVRVPTPDQDNEATNKAYVDTAIAAEATARASAITAAVSGDINASSLTTSGDLSVSGNSIFSGNSTFSGNSYFGNDIDVSGRVDAMDGRFHMLDVMGRVMASDIFVHGSLEMSGYRANFENASEVRVPTPDQPNEATNKAYVDGVVVPPGGLIAWSSASPLPTGWSDAGLSSPMPNYIWIIKN